MFQYLEEAQQQGKRARERCVESYSIGAMASIVSQVIANL
jgi:hypothetical protein